MKRQYISPTTLWLRIENTKMLTASGGGPCANSQSNPTITKSSRRYRFSDFDDDEE